MKQDTGLTLSETRGPLAKLLENLGGEHGDYWLAALKKMLRKEKLPEPPAEVLKQMETLDFRSAPLQRIQTIADYLMTIPTVKGIGIIDDEDQDLLNIGVYPNVTDFLRKIKDQDDAPFYLGVDGNIRAGKVEERDADETYYAWHAEYFKENKPVGIKDFCVALTNLGERYEKIILRIEVQ